MGLEASFETPRGFDDPSWVVAGSHLPRNSPRIFLWGFARKADAVIAARVMATTSINWDLPEPELRKQWDAFGGRDAMKKLVCERLQW